MKNSTKIILIVALGCILAGGAIFCLSMRLQGWDFGMLGGEKGETKTFEITESFRNISISADIEQIALRPSEDGKCTVVCTEKEKETHTVSVQDGTLAIQRVDLRKWYEHISLFSFGAETITVYLPQREYAALSIEDSTGDISIPADFAFDSIELRLDTGDADCRASVSGLLRIQTDTGDIDLEGLRAGELDLAVSTGHIGVRSVGCTGNIGVRVSTGKANLSDVTCRSLSSTGDTGDITLENVLASETISVNRTTGDVRFVHADAQELTIETDTGKVTGSLRSAKVFIARSDTGRIDVPETTSGGTCRITTDTGDIHIEIE